MARPTVYLLPGLLCDATVWEHQAKALSVFADVRIPDFRLFDSIPEMARSVLDDAPPRFSLVGHSMGARVAMEVVRMAPERVERLAMLDTGIHPRREGEAQKRQVLVDLANTEGMTALAERWLPPMVHPDRGDDGAFMPALRAMVEAMTPAIHERQIRALLNRPNTAPALAAVTCPVLLGVGRQDQWSPLSQHEDIQEQLPDARLVVFEDSGHMAPVEAPEAVTRALVDFLRAPPN